jgi:hypothetical protein
MPLRSHIVLHHSKTKDGRVVDAPAIFTFHTSYRHGGDIVTEQEYLRLRALGVTGLEPPWRDVGYHALVEHTDRGVISILGRDWLSTAAACPQGGMNEVGLHVCVVGDYDAIPPDEAVLDVLVRRIVRPWMHMFAIPAERIVGHRTFNPAKTCPGNLFDLEGVRRMAR